MSVNASGLGVQVVLTATNTYPLGVTLTQFPGDADPLDIPAIDVADTENGLNGDMVYFNKYNAIAVTLNIIPNSVDDEKLSLLFDLNRPGRGKQIANDTITLTATYADGRFITLSNGILKSGMPAKSIGSDAKMKSKAYEFHFENYVQRII